MTTLECIHGLLWHTCSLCYQKTLDQVELELQYQKEEQNQHLLYDYQDIQGAGQDSEEDLAYDLDDGM